MVTHILSMTYQPKIEGVRNGTIRQTIRKFNPKRPFKVGDKLLIHGWAGRPYRSRWNWKRTLEVKEVADIGIEQYGINTDGLRYNNKASQTVSGFLSWACFELSLLAEADGISPSTGFELKSVLERYHGKFTDKPVRFQVIRW